VGLHPANALRDLLDKGTPEKQTTAANSISQLAENPDKAARLLSAGLVEVGLPLPGLSPWLRGSHWLLSVECVETARLSLPGGVRVVT
jgi:hypothetical protein